MSTSIRNWSTSAAGNNATVAGINFAEGQLPSTVNNSARELMAQVRQWYEPDEAGWIDHAGTASVNSQTVIRLSGDQTGAFMPGRRVRLRGGSVPARYASVVSASFTSETSLTIGDADGSLSASMTVVGLATTTPLSMPRRIDKLDVSATLSAHGGINTDAFVRIDKFGDALAVLGNVSIGGTVAINGSVSIGPAAGINVAGAANFSATLSASIIFSGSFVRATRYAFTPLENNPGGGATAGEIYYNSSANVWRGFNGSDWVTFTTS